MNDVDILDIYLQTHLWFSLDGHEEAMVLVSANRLNYSNMVNG